MRVERFRAFARTLIHAGMAVMPVFPVVGGVASAADERPLVRLAVVNTPHQSGLLASLLPEFEKATGYQGGLDRQTWWPAGRYNNPAQLLGLTSDEDE